MKQETKSFIIVCDGCGEHFHDGNDFCSYIDDETAGLAEKIIAMGEMMLISQCVERISQCADKYLNARWPLKWYYKKRFERLDKKLGETCEFIKEHNDKRRDQ